MKSTLYRLLTAIMLVAMLASPLGALAGTDPGHPLDDSGAAIQPTPVVTEPAVYIILLEGAPLSSYRGEIKGLEATNPTARGENKLDAKSPASLAYRSYLAEQQAEFIGTVEQALGHSLDVLYQYDVVLNGLAARLTPQEAKRVMSLPGVVSVQRETIEYPDTDAGPVWIGAGSIWDGSAVPGGIGTQGEGVIVGILDTGINHDHASFADLGGDGYDHTNPYGSGIYKGYCVANPDFCNDKLIGAWSYTTEPTSPEDTDGHGSHTSSTAAGNVITATKTTPSGFIIEKRIQGVAPHANLIMYDVCDNGCPSAGSAAAVQQAVLDGVDVINFSISGGNNPYGDSVELAFLGASDAGVFVSTSAGNNGPGAGTVAHRSPWVSSTAATTHNRLFANSLVGMTGGDTTPPADMVGQGITTGYGPALIVYAGDFGDPLCQTPFPAGTWTNGEIVVCDRGINARVDKGANVQAGGAEGFVLANDAANGDSLVADPHYLPAVHITYADGVLLKTWLDTGTGHTATIPGTVTDLSPENGDIMASFSSRGPNSTFDVLKPDLAAPGVAIFAAYVNGVELEFLGGTSMASPHNAGAGALLTALFPDWSPAEMRSAIMTTASTENMLKEDGQTPADWFDMGAGRDDLTRAALAGLVLDETTANYQAANPSQGGDPQTLNTASLMDSNCGGVCSWTRTVKSTLSETATWTASFEGPQGLNVTVEPATFDLAAGGTQEIVITANALALPVDTWAFGTLYLTPSNTAVPVAHLPLAVKPTAVPAISINPEMIVGTQRVDKVVVHPLDLYNTGSGPLDWEIYEDGSQGNAILADWTENFDTYATGVSLQGLGGWKGWGNDPAAAGYTSDVQKISTPNSVEIVNMNDTVHEYTGATQGVWHYTAWQYLPADFTGETYFILLNQYDDAGATNNWSTQVNFNGTANQVINDGAAGGALPLVRGQWMEIKVEIDLDNDIQRFYYGGDLLFEGSWTEGLSGGGILNIAAVDLWGNGASAVYYDDMSLVYQIEPWSDNFDAYATGVSLHGLGGWKGWFNDPAATGYTSDAYARSTPNSAEIAAASDLVHEYAGFTTGTWYYTAWQYIPTNFAGETYFILLNQYDDGGVNLNWSTEVVFSSVTGQVANDGPAGGTLPMIQGEWVQIKVEIDLDNDIQRFYYGNDLLFQGSWTEGLSGGGILNIAAVDLFANNASEVYYDDMSLANALPDICDQLVDMPWVTVDPTLGTVPAGGSETVAVTLDSTGLAVGTYGGNLCLTSNDPVNPLIVVPVTMTVVLQDVVLTPVYQEQFGMPGETITHTLTLTNTGLAADSFDLTVSGNVWPTTAPATTGVLEPGEALQIDVVVTIPEEPILDQVPIAVDLFNLMAVSASEPSVYTFAEGQTVAEALPGVSLGDDQAASGGFGSQVDYLFTVTNLGTYTDSFTLELSGGVWTSTLSIAVTDLLAPGASQEVILTVDVPLDAMPGDTDLVTLTAVSGLDPATSDTATATTTAVATPGVDLGADQAITGTVGTPVEYVFTVTNLGDYIDTFALDLSESVFTSTLSITQTEALAPGASQVVTLTVLIPLDATAGMTDTVTLTATSALDSAVSDSATATTTAAAAPVEEYHAFLPMILRNFTAVP